MVETELVQDRRLQVVNVNWILGDAETEFIGRAVLEAAFDSAAGHPHREGVGIVIAAQNFALGRAAFAERRPPKLAAPNDQRVFKQTALLSDP